MDWHDPVMDYCERHDHGFWSEPLNAFTNVAFLMAAAAALVIWRRQQKADHPALALILLTAMIGTGSFVFHTVATRGVVLLDVIPIVIFIYGFFLLAHSPILWSWHASVSGNHNFICGGLLFD